MHLDFFLPKLNKVKAIQISFQFLMGLLGALLLMLVFHVIEPPKRVAIVDVTGLINRFVKIESKEKISSDQLKAQVQTFAKTLDQTLQDLAVNQHMVIFPKEAVIAGAIDLSEIVESRIKANLPGISLNDLDSLTDKQK